MDTIKTMLSTLGFGDKAIAIYLDLLTHGASSARLLATRLGVPRSSLYDQIRPLIEAGLVGEQEKDGKTVFAIFALDDLDVLLCKQSLNLETMRKNFHKVKDEVGKMAKLSSEPKVRFAEGKEAMVALLSDMLFEAKGEIYTLWPYTKMLEVLPEAELDLFNRRRIKQNIALKTIWTGPVPSKKDYLWRGGDYKVERRLAPKKFAPEMAYSIYGDSVLFFSNATEAYAFVVKSASFAGLMKMQFDTLWQVSK